jgi:hypothetical protein
MLSDCHHIFCSSFPHPDNQVAKPRVSPAKHSFVLLLPSHLPLQTDLPQAAQPREIGARHRQHKHLVNLLETAHQHLAHVLHRLGPAKALLDQLSLLQ